MPNSPRSSAVPVRTRPVPLLVTVTEAPDTMAPVLSSTVTLIVPVDTCAFTGSEVKTESENTAVQNRQESRFPYCNRGALRALNWNSEIDFYRFELAPPFQEPYRPC